PLMSTSTGAPSARARSLGRSDDAKGMPAATAPSPPTTPVAIVRKRRFFRSTPSLLIRDFSNAEHADYTGASKVGLPALRPLVLPFPVMDNLRKIGAFVVRSVVIGLALAFVVVWLRPDVFPRPDARETSYAAAVAEAAPTVVNVHIARRIPMRSPLLDDPFNLLPVPD